MASIRNDVLDIFNRAIDAEFGITINCHGDVEKVKQLLYRERKKARENGIYAFDILKIETSPKNPKKELWITKQKEPNDG